MKILLISSEYSDIRRGGAGVYAFELARNISRMGIKTTVLTQGGKNLHTEVTENLSVLEVKTIMLPFLRMPTFLFNSYFALKKILKNEKFDLIHSNNNAVGLFKPRVPLITTIQHPSSVESTHQNIVQKILNHIDVFLERLIVSRSSKIVATSKKTQELIIKEYPESRHKIHFIPIGVDEDIFKPIAFMPYNNILKTKMKICFKIFFPGGARARRKGLETLLQLKEKIDNRIIFFISGTSRELGWEIRYKKMLNKSINKENFVFLGEVSYERLPLLYSSADLTIFPSLFEGFGIPSIESLLCGTPVVCTNTGQAENVIRNGENGFLIDPILTSTELYPKIASLFNDRNLLSKMKLQTRSSVLGKYDWASLSNRYKKLYGQCLYEHC